MAGPPLPRAGGIGHAIALAAAFHAEQFQIDGKTPYICHVMHVVGQMQTEDEMIVAALHDIVEDTPMTIAGLINEGFDTHIVAAVDALTKRDGEQYLERYIPRVAENRLATAVKLQDLAHNMILSRLGREPTPVDMARFKKYYAAVDLLIRLSVTGRKF